MQSILSVLGAVSLVALTGCALFRMVTSRGRRRVMYFLFTAGTGIAFINSTIAPVLLEKPRPWSMVLSALAWIASLLLVVPAKLYLIRHIPERGNRP